MNDVYSHAYEMLVKIAEKNGVSDLERYFTSKKKKTMRELFEQLISSAQNRYSTPKTIKFNGENHEKLKEILFDFDPERVLKEYKSENELLERFKKEFHPNKTLSWERWSKSVFDSAKYNKDDLFCNKCGAKLQEEPIEPKEEHINMPLYCKKCGAEYQKDNIYCAECGAVVKQSKVSPAESVFLSFKNLFDFANNNTAEFVKCPYCASKLPPETKKCPNCGELIKRKKPIRCATIIAVYGFAIAYVITYFTSLYDIKASLLAGICTYAALSSGSTSE